MGLAVWHLAYGLWAYGFARMVLGIWFWAYGLAWSKRFWAYGFRRMVLGVWFGRMAWVYDLSV